MESKDKQVSFRITEEERKQLKILVAQEDKSLKEIVFTALDKIYPLWRIKK